MTRPDDVLALRRDALVVRANLQRVELRSALQRLNEETGSAQRAGGFALRCARWLAGSRGGTASYTRAARPWVLSAAWLFVRGLRRYRTLRWLGGAAAAGTAVWWIVRAVRAPDAVDDGSG